MSGWLIAIVLWWLWQVWPEGSVWSKLMKEHQEAKNVPLKAWISAS